MFLTFHFIFWIIFKRSFIMNYIKRKYDNEGEMIIYYSNYSLWMGEVRRPIEGMRNGFCLDC